MFGFTIIYNNSENHSVSDSQHIEYFSNETRQKISFYNRANDKFKDDQLFTETSNFVLGINGVVLNLTDLKQSYGCSSLLDLVEQLIEKKESFPSIFKGDFSGFVFNKKSQELNCFTNSVGTTKLYYSKEQDSIFISSSLENITKFRKDNRLNIKAGYYFLNFGGTFEDTTLVEDICKIQAGKELMITPNSLKVNTYFDYNTIEVKEQSKSKIIDELDELFNQNIQSEYSKDKEYGYNHLATLSGGLDSRMNVLAANKLGFQPYNFCFSQENYLDHSISKQISADLNNPYQFISLDSAQYLLDLEENLSIYDGQIFYLASAHFNYSLKQISNNNFGIIHTGQIGDAVLGGFVSKNSPNYLSAQMSSKLTHLVPTVNTTNYANEETFKLYNRLFNVTVAGSYVANHFGYHIISPFLDKDFISLCLSIPTNYKNDCNIYIDWINSKRPEVASYTWEKTGFKPNAKWKSKASRFTKKAKKVLSNNPQSMNPYDYWYDTKPKIQAFFENTFSNYLENINDHDLKQNMQFLFSGSTIEKSLAITLLATIKKYQLKT